MAAHSLVPTAGSIERPLGAFPGPRRSHRHRPTRSLAAAHGRESPQAQGCVAERAASPSRSSPSRQALSSRRGMRKRDELRDPICIKRGGCLARGFPRAAVARSIRCSAPRSSRSGWARCSRLRADPRPEDALPLLPSFSGSRSSPSVCRAHSLRRDRYARPLSAREDSSCAASEASRGRRSHGRAR